MSRKLGRKCPTSYKNKACHCRDFHCDGFWGRRAAVEAGPRLICRAGNEAILFLAKRTTAQGHACEWPDEANHDARHASESLGETLLPDFERFLRFKLFGRTHPVADLDHAFHVPG